MKTLTIGFYSSYQTELSDKIIHLRDIEKNTDLHSYINWVYHQERGLLTR